MRNLFLLLPLAGLLASCANNPAPSEPFDLEAQPDRDAVFYPDEKIIPVVYAVAETTAVKTLDDAADDPAIWVNTAKPSDSRILGTDKKSGVAVYSLSGELKQFLDIGYPNNIDLRQNVTVGNWQGDLVIASNRQADTVTVMSMSPDGLTRLGDFPSLMPEPYGACLGLIDDTAVVFITYKHGNVLAHALSDIEPGNITQTPVGHTAYATQLEGCVVDDAASSIVIGEEAAGVWRNSLSFNEGMLLFSHPQVIDSVDGPSGITADVEGITLYESANKQWLVVSSQGNDSYAVYDKAGVFAGRFRITAGDTIDGAQETDGIAVTHANLGDRYPEGILVAQDGFNREEMQNFKIVDWRDVRAALKLSP